MAFEDSLIYIVITVMIAGFGTLSAFFFSAKQSKHEAAKLARDEMTDFVNNTAGKLIDNVERKVDRNSNAIEIISVKLTSLIDKQDDRKQYVNDSINKLESKVAMLQQVQWGGSSHSQPDWVEGKGDRKKDVKHDEKNSSGTGIFSDKQETEQEEKDSTKKAHKDETQRSEDADKAMYAKCLDFIQRHPMGTVHELEEMKEKVRDNEHRTVVLELEKDGVNHKKNGNR